MDTLGRTLLTSRLLSSR